MVKAAIEPTPAQAPSRPYKAVCPASVVIIIKSPSKKPPSVPKSYPGDMPAVEVESSNAPPADTSCTEVCAAETRRAKMRTTPEMRTAPEMRAATDPAAGAVTAVPSCKCGIGRHSSERNYCDRREYSSKATQHR